MNRRSTASRGRHHDAQLHGLLSGSSIPRRILSLKLSHSNSQPHFWPLRSYDWVLTSFRAKAVPGFCLLLRLLFEVRRRNVSDDLNFGRHRTPWWDVLIGTPERTLYKPDVSVHIYLRALRNSQAKTSIFYRWLEPLVTGSNVAWAWT